MKVLRINESTARQLSRLDGLRRHVHRDEGASEWLITEAARDRLQKLKTLRHVPDLRSFEPRPLDPERLAEARSRLIQGWSASVHEPLPVETAAEVHLLLYATPGLVVEYMGRGLAISERSLPVEEGVLFLLDVVGGRRNYYFRKVNAPPGTVDDRMLRLQARLAESRGWLLDPKARLVLALGGGGFRMFAATSVLKVLDGILTDRRRVAEVWGSSGGAFIGYAYASGYDPSVIEEFGFDLYNGRLPHLVDGSTLSLIRAGSRILVDSLRGRKAPSEMAGWLDELERKQPKHARVHPELPLYSIASNAELGRVVALTDRRNIQEFCGDILLPCDPRDAVAASTAVPMLLRAQRGITGATHDTWVDGSVADENPVSLPYIKWLRERARSPETTPERLKILLVHLNLRTTESAVLKLIDQVPVVGQSGVIKRTAKLIDVLLDSKTDSAVQMMTATGNVEVMSLKLNLGTLSFKDPRAIAKSICSGRRLDSWQAAIYRSGF